MIRVFRHYIPKSLLIIGASEAALFVAATYLGVSYALDGFNPTSKLLVGPVWTKAALYAFVMMHCLAAMGLYQRGLRDELRGILLRAALGMLVGLFLMMAVLVLFPALAIGSEAFTLTFAVSVAGVLLFRTLVYLVAGNTLFRRRVLVVGAGPMASQVESLRRKVDRQDMVLVGYVPIAGQPLAVEEAKLVSTNGTLLDLATAHRVNEIVVAIDERRSQFPLEQILDCKMSGLKVLDLMTFFEQQTGKIKLDALSPSSMIFADGFIQAVLKGTVHRLFDVGVSLALLAAAWPAMLLAAAAIWLESGGRGPILYRQVRVGRDGRTFEVLKFRSMRPDAERGGARWAAADDARVTRVGAFIRKTRIDELPQLLNVLKGQMSFVGPRPERPEFVAELARTIPYYNLRHRVNPGITGWAQICYPYGSSSEDAKEKLQFDLYYIKNYSLFLDLTILIQTAQVILWGKGAR